MAQHNDRRAVWRTEVAEAMQTADGIRVVRPGLAPFRPDAVTIDADGVLHRGSLVLAGALELLAALEAGRIPWMIVTNNSRQTAEAAAAHYQHLGLPAEPRHVSTAAVALARYVATHHVGRGRPKVFSLASADLTITLRAAGCQVVRDEARADFVALGLDRRLSYDRLRRGCDAVMRGARFVAANLDPTIPTETGAIPGVGAIAAAIAFATGVEPVNIGKPSPQLMLQSIEGMGARPERSMHLGDRLDSDVAGARRAGMVAVLVTTGAHTLADALALPAGERPDVVADDLPALLGWLGLG